MNEAFFSWNQRAVLIQGAKRFSHELSLQICHNGENENISSESNEFYM